MTRTHSSDIAAAAGPTLTAEPPAPISLPLLKSPGKRYRISDAVFEQLSESIRNLQLPPGMPISEPAIAGWLQVSRSPVREAFTRLVDLGLITVVPQVGSHIAPISLREVEEAVFIRSALETRAFQRAIEKGQPDVSEIQRLVDANRAAAWAQDAVAFFNTDEELHQNVFFLAGVPGLWDLVRGTKMQLDRLRWLNLPSALISPELVDEHQAIVDALRDRDEKGGLEVINHHASRILVTIDKYRAENPGYFTP